MIFLEKDIIDKLSVTGKNRERRGKPFLFLHVLRMRSHHHVNTCSTSNLLLFFVIGKDLFHPLPATVIFRSFKFDEVFSVLMCIVFIGDNTLYILFYKI